jgi:hypothetical protein
VSTGDCRESLVAVVGDAALLDAKMAEATAELDARAANLAALRSESEGEGDAAAKGSKGGGSTTPVVEVQ